MQAVANQQEMSTAEKIGSVAALWRFPVKSMRGERIETADVTGHGLLGDRAYALIDRETGKLVSAVNVKHFPDIFAFRATCAEPPRPGSELPPVRIELPDGESVRSDSVDVDGVLSAYLEREVTLARIPPDGGSPFHDAFPVSVLTTSTLRTLEDLQPESRFDERRFRMNVIVDAEEPGFPENAWLGHDLLVGGTVRLRVAKPDARCVMTTLAQEELPRDPEILKALARHNRLQIGDKGCYPCAGVYAEVLAGGSLKAGDPVLAAARQRRLVS